jgi:hypothetical protein
MSTQDRLRALRTRRQSAGASRTLFPTPGGFNRVAISLVVTGEELIWVKDPNGLCLGRVGAGDKMCVKLKNDCDIVSHAKNRCSVPESAFLALKGPSGDVGHSSLTLETLKLSDELITDMLQGSDRDWASEFGKIKANSLESVQDCEVANELIATVRKHRSFGKTPSKLNVESVHTRNIEDLEIITNALHDMCLPDKDDAGEPIEQKFVFEESAYKAQMLKIAEQMEFIYEMASAVEKLFSGELILIGGFVKPIESVVEGLRLELSTVKENLGNRDFSKTDVPAVMWKALETSFEMINALEKGVFSCTKMAYDAKEISEGLLQAEEDRWNGSNPGDDSTTKDEDVKPTFLEGLDRPVIIGGNLIQPSNRDRNNRNLTFGSTTVAGGGQGGGGGGNNNHLPGLGGNDPSSNNCDVNDGLCSRCNVRFDEIEMKVTNLAIRVANLEEVKSGTLESAILLKNRVFRGRADVIAWIDEKFPLLNDTVVEAACFSTPHLIFNLVSSDMCGLAYPKLDLKESDLAKFNVKRSDAIAFYTLLKDRPDFMLSGNVCAMYTYKSSKSDREKSPIKFIPTYQDFGNSSDPDTLHHKFKASLHLIKERQEGYIESRLGHHSSRETYEISKQLLDDSTRFVSEILDFMEEVYSQCIQSFNAPTEAWALVCHCLQEIFTKEFKPSLKYLVANDLLHSRNSFVGVIHTAFSLNVKVRELLSVGISNHNSSSKSHVRFIMKMSRASNSGDDNYRALQTKYTQLESKHSELSTQHSTAKRDLESAKGKLKSLESRIDKITNDVKVLKERPSS